METDAAAAAAVSDAAAGLGPADVQFSPPDDLMAYYRQLMSLPPCPGEPEAVVQQAPYDPDALEARGWQHL
jgi:hypothetical protein